MTWRSTAAAVVAVITLGVSAESVVAPSAPEARVERPNFVVLMTDDQTVSDLRVMHRTRRLLGAHGVRFANSYVSYPVCCPSRATYLSGQYAHNHHVMGLYPPTGGYGRFDRDNALPVWLEAAGYVTSHIGKYLNGYGSELPADVPPGWTEWYGAVDQSTYRMWGYTLNENGALHSYGSPFEEDPRLYQTDVFRRRAVSFIERRAPDRRPFFLSVAFVAPHHEVPAVRARTGHLVRPAPRDAGTLGYDPVPASPALSEASLADKPAFLQRHDRLDPQSIAAIAARRRDRQESLLAVDDAVAAIVAALRRSGELDDTYILFTSDNGYMQGEHDVPSGKMLPYEPSTEVPLLLRGPGVPEHAVSHELVANVDLAPTILKAANARPGKLVDGRSLLPFARDPRRRSRRPLLHETGGRRYVLARDEDLGGATDIRRVMSYRAVRTRRWLWVEYRNGARELYDRRTDPEELNSLHADPAYRPVRAMLHRVLHRLARCHGATCRRVAPPVLLPRAERRGTPAGGVPRDRTGSRSYAASRPSPTGSGCRSSERTSSECTTRSARSSWAVRPARARTPVAIAE
jgi:N-acetylglucosamine-6-sulfatase